MKRPVPRFVLTAAVVATLATCALASDDDGVTRYTPATELRWADSGFGPRVSPVSGDFSTEGHVTYVRFEAGTATPPHIHTHDYVGIVITGVSMHWEPDRADTRIPLSAGAHWFMPGGVRHVSECLPGAECIMAIHQQEPMDFLPVER